MRENFTIALPLVLIHEGGFVNHPKDPGGATNQGVTQKTYDAWRGRQGQASRDVRKITDEEVAEIYRNQYWHKVQGDDLPAGLDYAVFDFAVNSGPARAAQFLQRTVGVDADGIIGAQTLAAVAAHDPADVIQNLCSSRLSWLKRLKTFATFGRGWTRRVVDVEASALAMRTGRGAEGSVGVHVPGKAVGPERATAPLQDAIRDPKAWAAGSGLLASLGGIIKGSGPIQYALAAAIVIGVAAIAYRLVRK